MPQGSKESGRPWTNPSFLLTAAGGLTLLTFLVWFVTREPARVVLKYGELKQVLRSPGVTFQKVTVGRSEIQGELVTHDAVSGSPGRAADKPVRWRTPRMGLEFDEKLQGLLDAHVGPAYQGEDDETAVRTATSLIVTTLVFTALMVGALFLFRWFSHGESPLTFGRSRHKIYAHNEKKISFQDVAGIDEAVAELREVVDFLKRPAKYQALGGRIPKGVLLVGPPGTGKTLLARAVAGEAGVNFFSLSGSDFVEMFVGVGAARVRDLFGQAEKRAPCIIFIDELDALGKARGGNGVGSHDEREQTLNQLLVEMDGFDFNRGVIIMAATNRPETLDPALLRPGRFDRTVVVDRPDVVGREAILKVHTRSVVLGDDVDLRHVASLTPGSVGADLANLVNEAALIAARRGKARVMMAEFDEAIQRSSVGLERKSRIMRADEKRRVAYHEAGHALVACALPHTDPVHKVSIIPRGVGALGYVLQRPEDDRHLRTKSDLDNTIKICLGGTIAEELTFDEISTGASNDLERASSIARRMVREFGMSRLGRVFYREGSGATFLANSTFEGAREHSEPTAREIDLEVRAIIDDAIEEVRLILLTRRQALGAVAERLIEREVIDGAELRQVLDQYDPDPSVLKETSPRLLEDTPVARRHAAAGEGRNGLEGNGL